MRQTNGFFTNDVCVVVCVGLLPRAEQDGLDLNGRAEESGEGEDRKEVRLVIGTLRALLIKVCVCVSGRDEIGCEKWCLWVEKFMTLLPVYFGRTSINRIKYIFMYIIWALARKD